jgi:hypothetical protein
LALKNVKASKKKKKEVGDETDNKEDSIAIDLINRMRDAAEMDHDANSNHKPALQRLIIANEAYNFLRKLPI